MVLIRFKYFRPIGLTESEAIDEAIKESLQQHEDDYQQPGPALSEEISEEQLVEDIKNHISQHVSGPPRNIVVSRLSVWETAAPHFKRRKFADAKSLLDVTFTSFEASVDGELFFHDSQQGRVRDKAPPPLVVVVVVLEYLST